MYREFLASGKTIKAWCEENGIARTTFHNRLKQIREAALEIKHEIVPVNVEICQRNPQWIELEKAPKARISLQSPTKTIDKLREK